MDFSRIKPIIGWIALAEVCSLVSYRIPWLSALFLILGVAIFTLIAWHDMETALWIIFGELMMGSKGYMFYAPLGEFKLSIRIALFCAIMVVWCIRAIRERQFPSIPRPYWLVLAAIVWGSVIGFTRYPFSQVFFDMNGYLFALIVPVVMSVFTSFEAVMRFIHLLSAAAITVSAKTATVLYLFSHPKWYSPIIEYVYKWIRDTGVGEITFAGGGFWRIFFQSHIFLLAAIFIFYMLIAYAFHRGMSLKELCLRRSERLVALMTVASLTAILISFSRSYWMGLAATGIACAVYVIWCTHGAVKTIMVGIGAAAASVTLMFAVAYFPIPSPDSGFGLALLRDRLSALSGEAGVSSRWNLLPPLIEKIKERPFFGSGFGTTVSFQTEDPRIKTAENPQGWYTTAAFEWGYFDTVTELGMIGLIFILLAIGGVVKLGIDACRHAQDAGTQFIVAGFLLGMLALLVTHAVSPYLNHPLGIGYMLASLGVFSAVQRQQHLWS